MFGFVAIIILLLLIINSKATKDSMKSRCAPYAALEENCLRFEYYLDFIKEPVLHPNPEIEATKAAAKKIIEKGYRSLILYQMGVTKKDLDEALSSPGATKWITKLLENIEQSSLIPLNYAASRSFSYPSEYMILKFVSDYFISYKYDQETDQEIPSGLYGLAKRTDESYPSLSDSFSKEQWEQYCDDMETRFEKIACNFCKLALEMTREYRRTIKLPTDTLMALDSRELYEIYPYDSPSVLNRTDLTAAEKKRESSFRETMRQNNIDFEARLWKMGLDPSVYSYKNPLSSIEEDSRKIDIGKLPKTWYPPTFHGKTRDDGKLHFTSKIDPSEYTISYWKE